MPLLAAQTSQLLLIDFQARLLPAIEGGDAAVANAVRLCEAAKLMGVPTLRTEQYPQGLGPTVPPLANFGEVVEKRTFSSLRQPAFKSQLVARQLVVAGCETHVCVLQTVIDLIEAGHEVWVVADAVGSRTSANWRAGLDRMQRAGADLVTTEMVLFEWLGTSEHPHFKTVSGMIK